MGQRVDGHLHCSIANTKLRMAQAGVSAREASWQVQRAVRYCVVRMMMRVAQLGSYSCGSMTCDTLSGRCVRVSAPSFKRLCLWACRSMASSEEVTHTRALDDAKWVAPVHGGAGREIVLRRAEGRCCWPSLSGDDEVGEVGASAS